MPDTIYTCRKCPHSFTIKEGQIITANVKTHCGLVMQAEVSTAFYHFQWSDCESDCEHAHTDDELRQLIREHGIVGEPFEIVRYSGLDLDTAKELGHGLYLLTSGSEPLFTAGFEEGELIGFSARMQND